MLMAALGVVVGVLLLSQTTCADWDEVQVAELARDLADSQNLICFGVLHPGSQGGGKEVFRTVKALSLQIAPRLRLVRVVPFHEPGDLKTWVGCSQVLFVLLTWLPRAQQEFPKFTERAVTHQPTWLLLLPTNMSGEAFIGSSYIPFTSRVVLAERTGERVMLQEVWRVAPGLALRTAHYAVWGAKHGMLCVEPGCHFFQRRDLEGAPLRAATKDDKPLSLLVQRANGELAIEGYFGDVYYELVEQLNATAMVIYAPENVTGFATNGIWNGLIGMMSRNETDLAVGPISVHASILGVADFVRPLLRTSYQVFFKQDGTVIEWDAFLKPFGKFVWRLILLWFLVGGFALNLFYRVGVRCGHEDGTFTPEFSKVNAFLTLLKAFCQQGNHLMPQSLSCRGLFLTGYLTSTILVTAYSAALISKLTLQEPIRPFDSLETFLKDGTYTLTAIGASTDYTYFSEATDTTLRKIYQNQMARVPMDELPMGKEDALAAVCERSKTALFITFAVTQLTAKEMAISRKCPILHFQKELGVVYLTIGIRKNMPYAAIITHQLQAMAERGVLKRLRSKVWPMQTQVGSQVAPPQVEIQQVAQIHGVLLIGLLAAILVLCAEFLSVTSGGVAALRWLNRRTGLTPDATTTVIFLTIAVIVVITLIIHAVNFEG